MEQVFEKKELCCGCGACKSICPKQAISMEPDGKGFLYPLLTGGFASTVGYAGRCARSRRASSIRRRFLPLLFTRQKTVRSRYV